MKEELFAGLTEEQIAKVKACKSQEEMLAIAKEEGVELNEEQLDAVSGGNCVPTLKGCPKCGSNNLITVDINSDGSRVKYQCNDCHCLFDHSSEGSRILG